jgi:energy-coupling factor transporter ATP-binding protein EcfA2
MATKTERVRLHELQVEGFKKIKVVRFKLRKGITEIAGRNGAGKSSVLDAVKVFFDGLPRAKGELTEPINNNVERAIIRGRIGDMLVSRVIARKKGGEAGHTTAIQFQGTTAGSRPYRATQDQLDDLIGQHNLDPLDFIRLDAKGKFDALKAFVTGFDFEKNATDHAGAFQRRTVAGKMKKDAEAAAALIHVPPDTPEELIDEDALTLKLTTASEENAQLVVRANNRNNKAAAKEVHQAVIDAADQRIADEVKRREAVRDAEIRALNEQIQRLQEQIREKQESITKVQELCLHEIFNVEATVRQDVESRQKSIADIEATLAAAGPLPEPHNLEEIRLELTAARVMNEQIRKLQQKIAHGQTARKYAQEVLDLNNELDTLEKNKRDAIAKAGLPIEGIEFGDGELRYQGAPLEQASTGQKLKIAMARIVKLNPNLRLAWIRDASLLDDDSYKELDQLAREFECDVMIETVRTIGNDAIVLADGAVFKDNDPSEAFEEPAK